MRTSILAGMLVCGLSSIAGAHKPDKKCQARLALLEKRVAEIPTHVGFGLPPMTLSLPATDRGTPVTDRGIIIDVKGDQIGVEGVIADEPTVDEKLARIKKVEELIQHRGAPAYMRIDRQTKLQDALPLMCRIAAKREVYLVVQNKSAKAPTYEPPPPSRAAEQIITDLMRRRDPAQRAQLLSKAFGESVKGCSAIQSVVSAVYVTAPEDRTHFLKRAIVAGSRACECSGIDVDTIESLVILMTAPISPPTFVFEPKLPCGQAAPFGLAMSDRYGELVEKMLAAK